MNIIFTLKNTLISIIALGLIGSVGAQHHCGTDHYLEEWRKANPNWQELEKVNTGQIDANRRTGKRIIPIVFHVLHTNGAENISNEQILDQIRVLNEDFSKSNPDTANVRNTINAPFKGLIADLEIEFVLAKKDPNGNCTNGINRIFTPMHEEARDAVKDVVRWPVNRYLNIWVVSSIESSGGTGTVLGFANFPWMPASTDGIVIRSDEVGTIGTGNIGRSGRTLTHEVGHYLGLFHTFQGGCNGAGDGVADTPPVASTFVNASCPPNSNSCPSNPLFDQWENYMDYSLGCQYMFTTGQMNRVNNFLTDVTYTRRNLYSQANLEFTGVEGTSNSKPLAYFESNFQLVCTGQPIQFFDNSCLGVVEQRIWTFQGANILSSSHPSPIVTYDTPGEYTVKLVVSNSFGSSTSEVVKYIRVVPSIATLSGIAESFELTSDFSVEGIIQIQGVGFGSFEQVNTGHFGSSSIKANITSGNIGTRYILETPYLDISKMSDADPKLSFMVAHARRTSNNNDFLRIYVSEDCGNTWIQRVQRVSGQFASAQGFISGFTPQGQGDWLRFVFNLFEYKSSTNLKIRIEIESGGGNPVYIDDINVSQYFTSVNTIERLMDVVVYPNPSSDLFTINLSSVLQNTHTQITLMDMSGRELTVLFNDKIEGQHLDLRFEPRKIGLVSGIYFLKIETNEGILTKKLIFAD